MRKKRNKRRQIWDLAKFVNTNIVSLTLTPSFYAVLDFTLRTSSIGTVLRTDK